MYLLHISLRWREKEGVLLIGFFEDMERDWQQEKKEPKITSFFKKRGRIENAFCKGKTQYGVVCDKILMKSKLLY